MDLTKYTPEEIESARETARVYRKYSERAGFRITEQMENKMFEDTLLTIGERSQKENKHNQEFDSGEPKQCRG